MFRLHAKILSWVGLMVMMIGAATTASASPILPGYDLFFTDPAATWVNIGGNVVHLQGVPLGTLNGVNLYDTDTIIQRHTGIDPFPVGGTSRPMAATKLKK